MAAATQTSAGVGFVHKLEEQLLSSARHVKHCGALLNFVVGAETVDVGDDGAVPQAEVCIAAVHALRRFFVKQCKTSRREMRARARADGNSRPSKKQRRLQSAERRALSTVKGSDTGEASAPRTASEKLRAWLVSQYRAFLARCTTLLFDGDEVQQVLAVRTLFALIPFDGPFVANHVEGTTFGHATMLDVMKSLVSAEEVLPPDALAVLRTEFLNQYADVRCYSLRALCTALQSCSTKDESAQQVSRNALELLLQVHVMEGGRDASSMKVLAKPMTTKAVAATSKKRRRPPAEEQEDATSKLSTPAHHTRLFGQAWLAVLQRPLAPGDYQKALLVLPKKVIPCIPTPLALSDFLTDSYNLGGVASVLALQSLFDLIMKHNLDYPDFFAKLYLLLQPAVLHTKYRARFLRLLGLFLASPLMPTYVVASFAKRLSWLALHGTPASGLYVCALVHNLMQRHPSCLPMIQRKRKSATLETLGNAAFAPPPALTVDNKIMKTSLYELKGLRSHYAPMVASMASVFEQALDKAPYNVQDFAGNTYADLLSLELRRGEGKARRQGGKAAAVALNHRSVPAAVMHGDDAFCGCFAVPAAQPVQLVDLRPGNGDGDGETSSDSDSSDEE